jgi:hypothetical protein
LDPHTCEHVIKVPRACQSRSISYQPEEGYYIGVPDALRVSLVHVAIIAEDLTGAADTVVQFACLNSASAHELNVSLYVPQKRPEAKPRWCVNLCVIELAFPGVILPNLFLFNRRALSDQTRLNGYCVVVIVIKAVFFVSLSLFLLYQIITNPTPLA